MCGIAGVLEWGAAAPDVAVLERMTGTLAHRGPDDSGTWTEGPVGLGHRRLSILDLSAAGRQPMSTADGALTITYNGEVYNYRELRSELQAHGHGFASGTDTEVILAAYRQWGIDCLARLNGMFAFGLWDAPQQRLWLVRDRLGVKPLFYCRLPGALLFGSEIKAVLEDPRVPRDLDLEALAYFLGLNYTPAPFTLFRDVRQLLPGHHLMAGRSGAVTVTGYWDLEFTEGQDRGLPAYREELRSRLADAVRLRLVSDVPFGVFLSGGLDSSAVALEMSRLLPETVRSFTMGFADREFDELAEAREVASIAGTEHCERVVTADIVDVLPRIVWHSEEPTADASMVAVYHLAAEARRSVAMVLTGDGADEVLAGYDTYVARRLVRIWQFLPRWIRERMVPALVALIPPSLGKVAFDERLRRFVSGASLPPEEAHATWRQISSAPERRALLAPVVGRPGVDADPLDLYRAAFARNPARDPLDRLLYVDTRLYLPNDMLVKVDRMTMAHGLEARTPFLDYGLVEFLARVPSRYKLAGFASRKHLLKEVLRDRLPRRLLERRKMGFNAPVGRWMRGRLREFLADHLAPERVRAMGVLDAATVTRFREEHLSGAADRTHQLWGLLTLALWWDRFRPRLGGATRC